MPRTTVIRAASLLLAIVVAACTSGPASTPASSPIAVASVAASSIPTPPSMPSASASTMAATPGRRLPQAPRRDRPRSPPRCYGYSLTVPAGWTIIQATAAWDGKGAPFHDVPEADQFVGPAAASAWFFGAPTTKDLAGKVKESIAANAAEHGNTCPPYPRSRIRSSSGPNPDAARVRLRDPDQQWDRRAQRHGLPVRVPRSGRPRGDGSDRSGGIPAAPQVGPIPRLIAG